MGFRHKIKDTIRRNNLFLSGDKIIVAVSGGADSIFLAAILFDLRHELGIWPVIAHINHHLRPDSQKDETFVEKYANQLNLPFVSKSVRITKIAGKSSLEELAREKRFAALMQIARKFNTTKIALGHTKNDLAETVLMRILRGAGLSGLRGILPLRHFGRYTLIRPLLDVTRSEIEDYLSLNHIPFRTDSTNKDLKYFRNKIRLELLPKLEKDFNYDMVNVLSNMAKTVATDYDYLTQLAESCAKAILYQSKSQSQVKLHLSKLTGLHPSLQRMMIRMAIERLKDNTRRIHYSHIAAIENLLSHCAAGSKTHLPGQMRVSKSKDFLTFQIIKS